VPPEKLQAVPGKAKKRDRTWESASALRQWFQEEKIDVRALNVVSLGAHARRTRLIYEHAFGQRVRIGIIAIEDVDYDPHRWWTSSSGFRTTISELIGLLVLPVLAGKGVLITRNPKAEFRNPKESRIEKLVTGPLRPWRPWREILGSIFKAGRKLTQRAPRPQRRKEGCDQIG